ncbi:MAG: hypothetical protein FWE86_01875 [Oscillospiraceae bacterium]|nr:hypothetical protein [Oscillospiraceae bacterium]
MKKNVGFIFLYGFFLVSFLVLCGVFGWLYFGLSGETAALGFFVFDFAVAALVAVLMAKEIRAVGKNADKKTGKKTSMFGSDVFDSARKSYLKAEQDLIRLSAEKTETEDRAAEAFIAKDEAKEKLQQLDKSSPLFERALEQFDMADTAAERAAALAREAAKKHSAAEEIFTKTKAEYDRTKSSAE